MFRKFACGLFNYLKQLTVPICFSRIVALVPFFGVCRKAEKYANELRRGQKRYGADRTAAVTTVLIEILAGFGSRVLGLKAPGLEGFKL